MKYLKKILVPLILTVLLVTGISVADQTFNFLQNRNFSPNPTTVTRIKANYTALTTDNMITADTSTTSITITLPPIQTGLTGNGKTYTIQNTNAITGSYPNPVIIKASTTDAVTNTIESKTQRILAVAGYISISVKNGYDWKVQYETQPFTVDQSTGMQTGFGDLVYTAPTVSTKYTTADCGKMIGVGTDALTLTLPSASAGCMFTIVNVGAAGNNIISIASTTAVFQGSITAKSPNVPLNIISSNSGSVLTNTKSTSQPGDVVELVSIGTGTWIITRGSGTWTSL